METKEVYNKKKGKDVIFYLLQDYQTQTSLTKKIFPEWVKKEEEKKRKNPKYDKQKVNNIIQWNFSFLEELCETKKIDSEPTIRKGNEKPYIIPVDGYRLTITNLLNVFFNFFLKDMELDQKMIESALYPKSMREKVFNEITYKKYNKDIKKVFFEWLGNDLIIKFLNILLHPEIKNDRNKRIERASIFNFNKHKDKTPEEISKLIFEQSRKRKLCSSNYLRRFMDEDFIFSLIRGLNNRSFTKMIELWLFKECVFFELEIKLLASKNKKVKKLIKINKKTVGVPTNPNNEIKRYQKILGRAERLYKRVKNIREDLEKEKHFETYICEKDF